MNQHHLTIPKYLYHYFEIDKGPLRNITESGYDSAVNIQSNITEGWNSKRPPNYIELRMSLEKRIKQLFINQGGKPSRDDPFYFTLGECEWAKSWYINPGVLRVPIDCFKTEHISFTYPDSMVSFQFYDEPKLSTYRKACNGQVFALNQMGELITEYGLPSEEKCLSEERLKYDKYIETQVWDNTFVNHIRRNVESFLIT